MGDASDEAKARDDLERVRTENAIKAMQREAEMRKLREQQQGNQGNMVAAPQATGQNSIVADGTAGVGWPDSEVRAEPGRLTQAAGKLGLGRAGDAELAKRLLNDGQPAPGSRGSASGDAGKGAADTAGARAKAAGVRGVNPALEH
ncbi:hypothetical protein [Kribbella sp. CA-294648]|uniref:hypothetical protein n=1 Tax=Kribbella sp. CA-294648 TaxID=3239948 RepID=UPI003D8F7FD2